MKVEVSSPNAESENTLCTNSILGQTVVASSTSTPSSADEVVKNMTENSVIATMPALSCHETSTDINKSTNKSGK